MSDTQKANARLVHQEHMQACKETAAQSYQVIQDFDRDINDLNKKAKYLQGQDKQEMKKHIAAMQASKKLAEQLLEKEVKREQNASRWCC